MGWGMGSGGVSRGLRSSVVRAQHTGSLPASVPAWMELGQWPWGWWERLEFGD